jgi:hypothetical protein
VTTIRASCPDCGDVELTVEDVKVLVCAEDNAGSYAFRCPECRIAISKPAETRIIDLLVSSGVRMSQWHLPAEMFEDRVMGEPLTHDDLLDFHLMLESGGWFDRLAAMVGQ